MNAVGTGLVLLGTVAIAVAPGAFAQSGGNPLYRATGDHERTYKFVEAGIDSPYRVYVPATWDGKKKLPLVVILHGGGLTHDAAFDREPAELKGVLEREADKHGFIVVGVEGYHGAAYGNTYPGPLSQYVHFFNNTVPRGPHRPDRPIGDEWLPSGPMPAVPGGGARGAGAKPATQANDVTAPELNRPRSPAPRPTAEEVVRDNKLAEQDVLNVIGIVSKEYGTDPSRLYLMGNSMGGIGTYYFAAKYPRMFTAIAPSDGPIDPTFYPYENAKGIGGVLIVHGEDDSVAPIDDSEVMAYLFRKQGIDTVFDPVAKGAHGDSWYRVLPQIFDFYEAHPRRVDAPAKP
jgi:poly(3-hydroxybutyrate) depolymerase